LAQAKTVMPNLHAEQPCAPGVPGLSWNAQIGSEETLTIRFCLFAITVLACCQISQGQSGIPGCPGQDATTKENCNVAEELLNIYNGNVQTDTSLPQPLGGPDGSHKRCYDNFNESMHVIAMQFQQTYKKLKAKGDKYAYRDAAAKYVAPSRGAHQTFSRCMAIPLHKVETPGAKGPN